MALVYPYHLKQKFDEQQWDAIHRAGFGEDCKCGFDLDDLSRVRRVQGRNCLKHASVIPGSDADSSVFPYTGQSRDEMADTLARIKRREAEAALRSRLMNALIGLENAVVEARVAMKKWNEFCDSEEFGSSPNAFSSDSRVSPATEPTGGADIGSQEGEVASVSSHSKAASSRSGALGGLCCG
jgi:hypothetical protein